MPDYDAGLQAANAMKNGIGLKITLKEIFREKLKDLDRIWPKISCLVESFSQLSSQLTWTKTELSADFGAKISGIFASLPQRKLSSWPIMLRWPFRHANSTWWEL
mmetsp:Transcript_38197/g.80023  ORF Transcript_38197/g.80023 Transcript_38197/m.80023 type:complete len:105 (-) Transcript_38197:444-758(-)